MPYPPQGPGCCGGWGSMMAAGWIVMLVFWALVIAGIVLLVRALAARSGPRSGPDDALEILRRRYAAGEITREQFEEMKRTLA